MTKAAKDLLTDALRLGLADRAELASELLASLDGPADPDAKEAWDAEIRRRLASLDAGTATIEPWDDVKKRVEKDILGQ
jgi:putative addiction module component (TIGR02574 family)